MLFILCEMAIIYFSQIGLQSPVLVNFKMSLKVTEGFHESVAYIVCSLGGNVSMSHNEK